MGRREWRWWEEFEEKGLGTGDSGDQRRRAERQLAIVLRWAASLGFGLLAASKAFAGAWVFALAYAACAVAFFVVYGVIARRRQR